MEVSLTASIINFLLLVVLLAVKLREPIKNYVALRHHSVREEIQRVSLQLQQAQEKHDEFASKLKAIDAEIANLREQAKQEVANLKQRINSEARQAASRMLSDAKGAAEGLFSELRSQLYQEVSMKAFSRAEALLKENLTAEDRAKVRQEFSKQVETVA
jgi:F0F1-type ATP synthase membrane subunit b/b'